MQTSVPGIYAAGDVAEAPDLFSGRHLVAAIQPNAADQARIAALNMAGQAARMNGVLAINVLDSMGMISTSFGEWQGVAGGEGVERADEASGSYISLQFDGDVLVGATAVGLTATRRRPARADPVKNATRSMETEVAGDPDALRRSLRCLPATQ